MAIAWVKQRPKDSTSQRFYSSQKFRDKRKKVSKDYSLQTLWESARTVGCNIALNDKTPPKELAWHEWRLLWAYCSNRINIWSHKLYCVDTWFQMAPLLVCSLSYCTHRGRISNRMLLGILSLLLQSHRPLFPPLPHLSVLSKHCFALSGSFCTQ